MGNALPAPTGNGSRQYPTSDFLWMQKNDKGECYREGMWADSPSDSALLTYSALYKLL